MHFMFVAATFALLFFGYCNCAPIWGSTQLYGGCHKFTGKIICETGDAILPTAKVALWEADEAFFGGNVDDFITAAPVAPDGTFTIEACIWDHAIIFFKIDHIQVYLEFRDACPNVEYSYAHLLKPKKFLTYTIPKKGHGHDIITVQMSD